MYSKLLILMMTLLIISSCQTDSPADSRGNLLPKNASGQIEILNQAYPNDVGVGDSLKSNLNRGFSITLQPQGKYTLKLQATESAPQPEVNLFTVSDSKISIFPTIISGAKNTSNQWVFDIQNKGSAVETYVVVPSLVGGASYPKNMLTNLEFSSVGTYAAPLKINYIFLGVSAKFPQGTPRSSYLNFANQIHQRLRAIYKNTGIPIDTFEVLTSVDLGSTFTSSQNQIVAFDPTQWTVNWLGQSLSADLVNLGMTGSRLNALDVVIVDHISSAGYVGISPFYGRSLMGGSGSTLAMSLYVTGANGNNVSANSESEIGSTLAHEMGHFFGLRHTTASDNDREMMNDWGIKEDQLSDTPFGSNCEKSGYIAQIPINFSTKGIFRFKLVENIHPPALLAANTPNCPDITNLLFPILVPSQVQESISPMQASLLLQTFKILPH